jgi:protein-disulfide isomerase
MLMLALLFGAATAGVAAPARDWSKVATRTAEGTFVQGNPAAKVKLVAYLSMTCPHCAQIENTGIAPLTAKYIRPGLVSYEVRHALRDPYDFAASLLARCDGPDAFFDVAPRLFAEQRSWMSRAIEWSRSPAAPQGNLPPDRLLPIIAEGAGLDRMFLARGFSAQRVRACLVNTADQRTIVAQADEAWKQRQITGTPAFLINGQVPPTIATWADLDGALGAALK